MDFLTLFGALAFIPFLLGVHFWEKQKTAAQEPGDEELLSLLARLKETSELQLFLQAGEDWNIAEQRIQSDFDRYLLESRMPPYVRDYVRRQRQAGPDWQSLLDRRRDPLTCPPGTFPSNQP
ncbi:MAG: hypothetical protein ACOC43_13925 [Desulfohalobiaceae bacterium]